MRLSKLKRSHNVYMISWTWCQVFSSLGLSVLDSSEQRWKNIQACEQCLCKCFSSLGKICAKLYGLLSQKWNMSHFHAFIIIFWHFVTIFGAIWSFLAFVFHFMALLACYTVLSQIHFCHNLHTFLGKIVLAKNLLM